MKVYEVKDILAEVYCTDVAIVAANCEMEAYLLVADKYTSDNYYKVITFESAMRIGHIKEIPELEYKGNDHKIISSTLYVE